jgi:hypothetical protein
LKGQHSGYTPGVSSLFLSVSSDVHSSGRARRSVRRPLLSACLAAISNSVVTKRVATRGSSEQYGVAPRDLLYLAAEEDPLTVLAHEHRNVFTHAKGENAQFAIALTKFI